jgi:hypothetical protein
LRGANLANFRERGLTPAEILRMRRELSARMCRGQMPLRQVRLGGYFWWLSGGFTLMNSLSHL